MKRLLPLLLVQLLFYGTASAQIYKLSANAGRKITTCKGMFVSTGYVDASSNYYTQSDGGSVVTFCSGSGQLRMNFSYVNLEPNDYLEVFEGTTTAANKRLATLTGTNNDHKFYTSTGTCLTFRFYKYYSGNSSNTTLPYGWQGFLGCPPVACNGNDPASDFCYDAPVICNLDGYCGATSGWYTADNLNSLEGPSSPFATCASGGITVQNNSWLAFIANSNSASFSITSSNCSDDARGMQAMVLESSNCTSFNSKSNCVYDASGTFTLNATGLTVGKKYYIMVDGAWGNDCDYTVSAQSGIKTVVISPKYSTICPGGSQVLSALTSGATSYKWLPGGQTTPTITVSPSSTTTYTCEVAGVCGQTQKPTATVTVNKGPVITATPSPQSYCSPGTAAIALKSNSLSTKFTWTATTSGGSSTGSSNGSVSTSFFGTTGSISQTITATGTAPSVVTYAITGSTGGCDGNTVIVTVTINPSPTVTTTPASQALCSGGTTSIDLTSNITGTTYTWVVQSSSAGISGAAAGSGNKIAQTLTTSATIDGTVVYEITPSIGGLCPGAKKTVTITVSPRPVITPTATSQTLCSGETSSIGLQSNIAGTTFTWVATAKNGVTGASDGSGANIIQTLSTTGNTPGSVDYTITATTAAPAGCTNATNTVVTIYVNPAPLVSLNSPAPICTGESVTLTATVSPAGGTFLWTPGSLATNPITVSPASTTSYNVKYTISGCSGQASQNIIVSSAPTVTIDAVSPICSGKSATLTAVGSPAGGAYSWLPGGATGPSISVSPGSTTTYTVTYSLGAICSNTATTTLTVTSAPTVSVTSPAAICSGLPATLTSNVNPAGGTYAWSNGETTPSITVSPTTTTTYTLTYTVGTTCKNTATGAVTVNKTDDPNFAYSKSTYCGNAVDTVPLFIVTTPGTFSATPAGLDLNPITGEIKPSISALNTYAITYTTGGICPSSKTVNITVATSPKAAFGYALSDYCQFAGTAKPVFTGGASAGTFSATPAGIVFVSVNTGEIDLNLSTPGSYLVKNIIAANGTWTADTSIAVPINIIAAPTLVPSTKSQEICSPGTTNITLAGGTSYDWTVISPAFITGASAGSGASIIQTLMTTDEVPGTVQYIVTPKNSGCIGKPDTINVIVNPVPTIAVTQDTHVICSGQTTNIIMISNIPTATFSWTILSQTGVSGASAGSGSSINQILTATTTSTGGVVYHITPSAFGNCTGAPLDVLVSVNPNPTTVISFPLKDSTICSGGITAINLSSSTAGTVFSWTANQSGVSGATNGTGVIITDTLTTLGNTPGTVTYSITGVASVCAGATQTVTIKVNPIPTLLVTPLKQEICSGSQTNIALVSNPAGATFIWTVDPRTIIGASNGSSTTGMINQTLSNLGSLPDTATYSIIASVGGCTSNMAPFVDSVKVKVAVNPKPTATAVTPTTICSGDTTNIVITGTVVGTVFNYTATTATVIGAGGGTGDSIKQVLTTLAATDSVIYTIIPTSAAGCKGDAFYAKVIVNPMPQLSILAASQTVCSGTPISVDITSNISGTIVTWNALPSIVIGASSGSGLAPIRLTDVLSVPGDTSGVVVYNITASANGCSNPSLVNQLQITVNPSPKVTPSALALTICEGDTAKVSLTSNLSGSTFSWTVTQDGVVGAYPDSNQTSIQQVLYLTGKAQGKAIYTIRAKSTAGCSGGAEIVVVKVNPQADASFQYASKKYCDNDIDPSAIYTGGYPGTFSVKPAGLVFLDTLTGKIDLSASATGSYFIYHNTTGACAQEAFTNIVINPSPIADSSLIKIADENCGTVTGSITGIKLVSGIAPLKYEWTNAQGKVVGTKLDLDSVSSGIYTLVITDANGCKTSIGKGNNLNIKDVYTISADFTSDVSVGEVPLHVQFTNLSTSKTDTIYYKWDFGDGQTSTIKDPANIYKNIGEYLVCLMANDGGKGCADTICKTIEGYLNSDITVIPNIFTPNGDGKNDIFTISGKGLATLDAEIFNRWGQKMYEWHTVNGGWDGYTAAGLPATEGTYYLILKITGADKAKTHYPVIKQAFMLLR